MNDFQSAENANSIKILISRLDILENRMNESRTFTQNEIGLKVREKHEAIDEKVLELQKQVNILEEREQRVQTLEHFKEEIEEKTITNKMSFKSLENAYNQSIIKYDGLIKDNLMIPGVLGDYSKFKNLGEFIEVKM